MHLRFEHSSFKLNELWICLDHLSLCIPYLLYPPSLQLFVDHYHKINQFFQDLGQKCHFPKIFLTCKKAPEFSQTFPNIWRLYQPCITRIFHIDKTLEAEWMLKTSHSLTTKQKNWRISSTNNRTSFLFFYCKVLKTDSSCDKSVSGEGIAFMFGVSTLQPFAFMNSSCIVPFLHQILVTNCHSSFTVTLVYL